VVGGSRRLWLGLRRVEDCVSFSVRCVCCGGTVCSFYTLGCPTRGGGGGGGGGRGKLSCLLYS